MPEKRRSFWTEKFARNTKRDRRVRQALRRLGWKVLVIWECQLKDLDHLTSRIVTFLDGR